MIRTSQNATFNLTGRVRVPLACLGSEVKGSSVRITKLSPEQWAENVPSEHLARAMVHFDVSSLLYHVRETVSGAAKTIDPNWKGIEFQLPETLIVGRYRVKLQVTIVLPPGHSDGGRMLAQSAPLVLIEGDGDDSGDEGGSSLLRVKGRDLSSELWRLEFDAKGPILIVNSGIPDLPYRQLASTSTFKFGVLPGVLRLIYARIVISEPGTLDWEVDWMKLPGVAGRERPDTEGLSYGERVDEEGQWVEEVVGSLCTKAKVKDKFVSKWRIEHPDE